jgi:hypothetical protein
MPLFTKVIESHALKAHLSCDTGQHDWKHLSAVVLAFHTHPICVMMHHVTVPAGAVFVASLLNTCFREEWIGLFFVLVSVWYDLPPPPPTHTHTLSLSLSLSLALSLSLSFLLLLTLLRCVSSSLLLRCECDPMPP